METAKGILFKNLSKSFQKGKNAVEHLNLEITPGQIMGFIGPNGAGKTTTISMLTGIIAPTTGDVEINGKSITKDALAAKKQFSFVPDSPDMFLKLKGIEYLNFMADVYEVSQEQRRAKIVQLSEKFNLEMSLNDAIASYSHGMRQKLVIIGSLLHDPYLWVLDEPMTGLDPQAAFDLKEMMKQHAQNGNIVLFSTHVLEVAEKLCDKVVIINHGQIVFTGTIDDIRMQYGSNKTLEAIFLEMTNNEAN
ncbi:MAG: ABC transporter ATP-binding protein [Culicoidibacterales bacterium]